MSSWRGILSATAFAVRSTYHTTLNTKRIPHDYKVGDQVLLSKGTETKYETPYSGPHTILQVFNNGTVCLKVKGVTNTYNICRITPYIETSKSNMGENAVCISPGQNN